MRAPDYNEGRNKAFIHTEAGEHHVNSSSEYLVVNFLLLNLIRDSPKS